jgi:iron complex transport system substrate-binding protein
MSAAARVVSLLPSATEILFAIGAGDRVVAVTHECDHPEAARDLPAVTSSVLVTEGAAPGDIDRHIHAARHAGSSIYRLDEPALARLEPDLIITQELCDVCAIAYSEVRRAVRRLPGEVPVLSLEPRTVEEICCAVEEVGVATGRAQGASEAAMAMRRHISEIGALEPPEPRPRVVCIEWTDPLMVGGHWVPEMVRIAGGVDVLGEAGAPSRYVSWDKVIEADPEVNDPDAVRI